MTVEDLLFFAKQHIHSDHAKILLAELFNKNPLELLNHLKEIIPEEKVVEVKNESDDTESDDDNLFDLYKDAYIVPGVEYRAEMLVTNNGSTTFGYYIEIIVSEDSSPELCEQLYITITAGDKKVSGTLSDLYLGTEADFISVIEANGSSTFDIEVVFQDNDNSNAAMDKTVYFDLVVNAVQIPSSTDSNNN